MTWRHLTFTGLAAAAFQILSAFACVADPPTSNTQSFLQRWGPTLKEYCDPLADMGIWLSEHLVKEKHVAVVQAGGVAVGFLTCKVAVPYLVHRPQQPPLSQVEAVFHPQEDVLRRLTLEAISRRPIRIQPAITPGLQAAINGMSSVPLGRLAEPAPPRPPLNVQKLLRGDPQ